METDFKIMLREELYIKNLCLSINFVVSQLDGSHFIWTAKYWVGEFEYVVSLVSGFIPKNDLWLTNTC